MASCFWFCFFVMSNVVLSCRKLFVMSSALLSCRAPARHPYLHTNAPATGNWPLSTCSSSSIPQTTTHTAYLSTATDALPLFPSPSGRFLPPDFSHDLQRVQSFAS